ncbi:hypothetical protein SGQ83_00290 [Flavobacterium sp. Fl-318]|uniref:Uncharacterized protein n=1 Tax=Flavobacterium cupriresistens TaxID=2893885 RepID=A0ABU4R5B2_9FLAO|nr:MULTISPECIES: hypothetical protein [unclassified Flavobacterium]MDX6187774.1 hypothetical protein [Flavobacterium sp. Fl-318]UFH42303.1 hypothetical protein LNP23_21160 [Flavobacterium sp. F-323]
MALPLYILHISMWAEQNHERNVVIQEILLDKEKDNTKGILLLGINTDKNHYPYLILASNLASQLFDAKFLEMVNIPD